MSKVAPLCTPFDLIPAALPVRPTLAESRSLRSPAHRLVSTLLHVQSCFAPSLTIPPSVKHLHPPPLCQGHGIPPHSTLFHQIISTPPGCSHFITLSLPHPVNCTLSICPRLIYTEPTSDIYEYQPHYNIYRVKKTAFHYSTHAYDYNTQKHLSTIYPELYKPYDKGYTETLIPNESPNKYMPISNVFYHLQTPAPSSPPSTSCLNLLLRTILQDFITYDYSTQAS